MGETLRGFLDSFSSPVLYPTLLKGMSQGHVPVKQVWALEPDTLAESSYSDILSAFSFGEKRN